MFLFVNYISRSGSTYLCRLLDEYADIGVGIEAGFPGFTKHLISPEFNPIKDETHLEQYLDLLFDDIRFKQWEIDRMQLLDRLKSHSFPIRFNDILKSLFEMYFRKHDYSVWVHKAGYYIECFDDVSRLFPNSKSIFIIRDPRSIYNSMKVAKEVYFGKSMGGNILNFIHVYKKRVKLNRQLSNQSNFISFKYEDLIQDTEGCLENVLNFIGLENRDKKEFSDYSQQIPENQKHLHTNIKSGPIVENIDKWRNGLTNVEIYLIQQLLEDEMAELGYRSVEARLTWSERIKVGILSTKFRLQSMMNMLREK